MDRMTLPKKTLAALNACLALIAVPLALALPGCGGDSVAETAEVSGVVLYKGQPVAGAEVNFRPKEGHPATGRTGPDGRFVLTTYEEGDGAVPGTHTVTVQLFPEEALPGMEAETSGAAAIPEKYADPASSPLTQEVKAGEKNDLTLELVD
jgi:hypothetical protein